MKAILSEDYLVYCLKRMWKAISVLSRYSAAALLTGDIMREIIAFSIRCAILTILLTGIFYLLGRPFGVRFIDSLCLSWLALVFAEPGIYFIYACVSPRSDEPYRILTLIRGIGFLIAFILCAVPLYTRNKNNADLILWGMAFGFFMYYGITAVEILFDFFEKKKREK